MQKKSLSIPSTWKAPIGSPLIGSMERSMRSPGDRVLSPPLGLGIESAYAKVGDNISRRYVKSNCSISKIGAIAEATIWIERI